MYSFLLSGPQLDWQFDYTVNTVYVVIVFEVEFTEAHLKQVCVAYSVKTTSEMSNCVETRETQSIFQFLS